ncbi:MAG: FHA domain-containing protein [Ktedonobacterales bacterium]
MDLAPFDNAHSVSHKHAQIRVEQGSYALEDFKSLNMTQVGGLGFTPFQPKPLNNRDEISFGLVKAPFRLMEASELPTAWSIS